MSDQDKAFDDFRTFCGEEDKWTLSKEKDGVKVSSRTVEGCSLNIARGVLTVKATVDQCYECMMDSSTRCDWDKMIKEARLVRKVDDNHFVFYMMSVAKWPAASRDFIIDLHVKRYDDGTIVCLGKSPEAEEVPCPKGVVRGKAINSGYIFAPGTDGTTNLTYVMQLDMGGWLPTSVVNMAMTEEPLYLAGFRESTEKKYKQ